MIALRNAFSFAKYTVFPRIPIKLGFYPFFVTHAQCCMNVMCVFILSTSESIFANLTIATVVKITFIRDLNILSNNDPFHFHGRISCAKNASISRNREESCIGRVWISSLNIVCSSGKGCEFRILFLISIDVGTPPRDWHLNMSDFQFHE